jgi:hypothetical protein
MSSPPDGAALWPKQRSSGKSCAAPSVSWYALRGYRAFLFKYVLNQLFKKFSLVQPNTLSGVRGGIAPNLAVRQNNGLARGANA